jgi:hypothetical protein
MGSMFVIGSVSADSPNGPPPKGLKAGSRPRSTESVLTLTLPPAGVQLKPGAPDVIHWTGGATHWQVSISIVDVDAWTVAGSVASNINNSGSFTWTIPFSLACNRRYEFYIQGGTPVTWDYGPVFRLKCDVRITKQKVGSNYQIKLVNGHSPIVSLINPANQQTRSVPIFTVTDSVPAGMTITGGSGSGPGTWMPATVPTTVGSQTLPLVFTLNTQTTIAPGAVIAQYTFVPAFTVANCASENMAVSDALTGGSITALADPNPANNTHICAP